MKLAADGLAPWHSSDRCRKRLFARSWSVWAIVLGLATCTCAARAETKPERQARREHAKAGKAKTPPRATLLATAGGQGTALDAVVHAGLEKLAVVDVVSLPGMDLQAFQMLLDCVGETGRCLKAVAAHSQTRVLIAPSLQRAGGELVVSLLRFDAAGGGTIRRVLRRQPGSKLGSETLDAVPGMLRELFDLPPLAEPQLARAAGGHQQSPVPVAARPAEEPKRSVSVAPLIMAGIGIGALGAGIALGVVMKNQQSEYERRSMNVRTTADADAADRARSVGASQELAANALFVLGGAALATAAIWLVVDLSAPARRESEPRALTPVIGLDRLALVWTQRGDVL